MHLPAPANFLRKAPLFTAVPAEEFCFEFGGGVSCWILPFQLSYEVGCFARASTDCIQFADIVDVASDPVIFIDWT